MLEDAAPTLLLVQSCELAAELGGLGLALILCNPQVPAPPVAGKSAGRENIDGLANLYFDRIQQFRPHGPLVLAEVLLGAFAAFRLAMKLRQAGRAVSIVAIFDADEPAPAWRSTTPDRLGRPLARIRCDPSAALRRYVGWTGGELGMALRVLHLRLRRLLRRKLDQRSLADFVAANIAAVAACNPSVYPGRVVIFAARDDLADIERVRQSALVWGSVAPDRRFVCVPGDHLGILNRPGVRVIAQVIKEELAEVSPRR